MAEPERKALKLPLSWKWEEVSWEAVGFQHNSLVSLDFLYHLIKYERGKKTSKRHVFFFIFGAINISSDIQYCYY